MKRVIAAVALAIASPAFATNYVVNGGFEQVAAGAPSQGFEVGTLYNYGQAVLAWNSARGSTTNTAGAFNVLFNSATATTVSPLTRYTQYETQTLSRENYGGPSPNGGNFMALDGDINANGFFSQTINGLTVGKTYELSFYWAGTQFQNRVGQTTIRLDVSIGADSFSTATLTNPTHGFQGWYNIVHRFVPRSSSETLSFLAVGTPNGLPPVALLDGVEISPAPEPDSWIMMIAGFGLIGATARRQRHQAAA